MKIEQQQDLKIKLSFSYFIDLKGKLNTPVIKTTNFIPFQKH